MLRGIFLSRGCRETGMNRAYWDVSQRKGREELRTRHAGNVSEMESDE